MVPPAAKPKPKPSAVSKGTKPKVHGVFKTEDHTLKKPMTTRKYRCQMCKAGVNSAKELLDHHPKKPWYCLLPGVPKGIQ